MAVGPITSPVQWLLRTVMTHTWAANIQDTLNNAYGYKSASRYLWLYGPDAQATSNWTYNGWYWQATGVGSLYVPLGLFYTASGTDSTTKRQKPSSYAFRLKPAGASTMALSEKYVINLGNTSAPTTGTDATGVSSGTAQQTVTVAAGGSAYQNDDQVMFLQNDSAQSGDQFFGVRVTYANTTITV